jgi:hypothetical protein
MTEGKKTGFCTLILLGIVFPVFSFAQYNDNGQKDVTPSANDKFFKYALQAGTEITYGLTDPAFQRDYSNGVYAANASFDASITKRIYVGVEIHDDDFCQAQPLYLAFNPSMFLYMGGVRVGYHSSNTGEFFFNATFTGGKAYIIYTNVPPIPDSPGRLQSNFGKLSIMEGYRVNDQFWIGLDVSFTYLPYIYSPYVNGYAQYGSYAYVPSEYSGATTYLGWGLQLYYIFGKK